MSGEPIRIDPISQPQAEAEDAALEVTEAQQRQGYQLTASWKVAAPTICTPGFPPAAAI
jgi:hypothetical protein